MKKVINILPAGDLTTPPAPSRTLSGLQNPPPLSLYIHIPWCVKKCPYCDFNSHEQKQSISEARYVQALIADLEQSVPRVYGRKLKSIFFGGGTPSLFSPESIDAILNAVRMLTPMEYDAEITLEANPGTVDTAHFVGYKQAGVNRISLGIQSFNPHYLSALGRIHNEKQALSAAELALNTFEMVNLDVMYALPKQTLADALLDAQTAVRLGPQHLSFYHLTLEPNTPFFRTPPTLPNDDASAEMQQQIEQLLADNGYGHYETSAFSRPSFQAKHNLNYWQFGDYLGIGAGAHSKLSFHDKICREARFKHPKAFMEAAENGNAVENMQTVNTEDLAFEFMMNTLRLTDGFAPTLFQQRTGQPLNLISAQLRLAQAKGLLEITPNLIKPTLLGQRFLNDLLQLFL